MISIKKKIAVLGTSLLVGISSCMPAFAAELTPRAIACGKCSNGGLIPRPSYTPWEYSHQQFCAHKPFGVDIISVRRKVVVYVCNSCLSAAFSETFLEEMVSECQGKPRP